ncbi:hypothetical protein UB32_09400 [Mesobacillus subterraneus]|uniref:Uncharacterized protein n=1 Tax=Mesobacillus subterraneus TaxID=285983 RepID=A0A0D6Z9H9_9BACI|nr:hypothetical protein UB32_09400 [Mesobacillus subterraneus]
MANILLQSFLTIVYDQTAQRVRGWKRLPVLSNNERYCRKFQFLKNKGHLRFHDSMDSKDEGG